MNLGQLLDIIASFIGLLSSIYFCRSSFMSVEEILLSTTSEAGICFSDKQVSGMSSQKANSLVGAIFLFITFCIQLSKNVTDNEMFIPYTFLTGCIILSFATCILFIISNFIKNKYVTYINKKTEELSKYRRLNR